MNRVADRLRQFWRDRFAGGVSPLPYDLFRIGTAVLVLVRTTDLWRPAVDFYHHTWVKGWEYDPRVEGVVAPALDSPLIPGLHVTDGVAGILVSLRTVLAIALLLGIRVRIVAPALAMVGGVLLAADRYRYLHHMQLLWLMVGWIALGPPPRFGVERFWSRAGSALVVPRWPLQLWRLQALSIYLAAGVAKLDAEWLRGKTLRELTEIHMVGGAVWDRVVALVGFVPVSVAIVAVELGLPCLLGWRQTRLVGVLIGVAFHAAVATSMSVSIFGAQMVLFLCLFLPFREEAPGITAGPSGPTTRA